MVFQRGVCVPAQDTALHKKHGAEDSFPKNPCVWHISCAIFTKYMIHRFIKHGKRFVEKIHKKISVKIADLRDAGNYAINPAILQSGNCTTHRFALFRRGYRRISFIARMDRFGKRSATCRGFRCGCAEKRLPLRGSQSKRNVYRAAKTRGRFYSRLFRARCTHVFK